MRPNLGKIVAQTRHMADEVGEVVSFAPQPLPIDPAGVVVLAIGIVIAILRIGDLVAGQQQWHALCQQQQAIWFLRSRRRSDRMSGSSVGPSCPQLLLWLSLEQ